MSSDRPTPLASARQQSQAVVVSATRRVLSNREIDLLLLAFCSCLLTVICHPSVSLFQPSTSSGTAVTMPATSSLVSDIDFMIKSGLLTNSRQEEEISE
jgi:hypothetical protein